MDGSVGEKDGSLVDIVEVDGGCRGVRYTVLAL